MLLDNYISERQKKYIKSDLHTSYDLEKESKKKEEPRRSWLLQ